MDDINWKPQQEKIKINELTEEEKKIAHEIADIEIEFNEVISMIELYNENDI